MVFSCVMYKFVLWPTHKWTTTGVQKGYKCKCDSIYNPLIRYADVQIVGVVAEEKQTGIYTTARLYHQSQHIHSYTHTHSNPAGAAQSQQHH